MHKPMLEKLHSANMGIESSLRYVQERVFWPGLNGQLKDLIQREICCSHAMVQSSEPLMCHPMPSRPWEVIGTDMFSLDNYTVLITVDYFSGFWEVDNLTSTTLSSVIRCLRQQFARYGGPVRVVSDNGLQFSSALFGNFSEQCMLHLALATPKATEKSKVR